MVFESKPAKQPFMIHCVEGSPKVYAELCSRVADNPLLKGHILLTQGLVGKRSGSTEMYESSFFCRKPSSLSATIGQSLS